MSFHYRPEFRSPDRENLSRAEDNIRELSPRFEPTTTTSATDCTSLLDFQRQRKMILEQVVLERHTSFRDPEIIYNADRTVLAQMIMDSRIAKKILNKENTFIERWKKDH